jgi:AcrR family transcriptional regulator
MSLHPGVAPRAAHRPSAREAMLAAAEAHLGADGTLTLDSAARAAGVTKPGLMYHFATKEALLGAVLERIAARYEREMRARIGARLGSEVEDLAAVPAAPRHLAYLEWAATAELSAADLVMVADPKLRVALTERWQEQVDRWLEVPERTPAVRRTRLLAVRLLADGLWFDRASGLLGAVAAEELVTLALEMLGEES